MSQGSRIGLATADDLRAAGIGPECRTRRRVGGVWDEWHLPAVDWRADIIHPPTPIPTPDDEGEGLTIREIAARCHVSTTAVSNWRRRFATFPAPHPGYRRGRPVHLWHAHAIEQWIIDHDKGDQ